MSTIFSIIGLTVFVALAVSAYKYIWFRNNFARLAFWGCAVILALMVAVDDRLGITAHEQEPPPPSPAELAAAFKDTEFELKKFEEVERVHFKLDDDTGELIIQLIVNEKINQRFVREITDEAVRIFLRAMVDNCRLEDLLGRQSFLSRLKISVELRRPSEGRGAIFNLPNTAF